MPLLNLMADEAQGLLSRQYGGLLDAARDPEFYRMMADQAKTYGKRALEGKVILTGEPLTEAIARNFSTSTENAMNMALNWNNPMALAGIFAGTGAKTADIVKLDLAKKLKAEGVPDADIWKQTGWALNTPDKLPRFEIPDNTAYISHPYPEAIRLRNESANAPTLDIAKEYGAKYNEVMDMVRKSPALKSMSVTAREDIGGFVHPELADSYNQIPRMWYENIGSARGGEFSQNENKIRIALGHYPDIESTKSVGLHELQHAIQQREGFAIGGSPEQMAAEVVTPDPKIIAAASQIRDMAQKYGISVDDIIAKPPKYLREDVTQDAVRYLAKNDEAFINAKTRSLDPLEAYKRLAGEAEARLTQARMSLTAEQRLAQYPYDPSYFEQATGVPLNSLIVRMGQ